MRGLSWRTALTAMLALASLAVRADAPPEDAVASTLKQLERAEQTGDANAWMALWSRQKAAEAEQMRALIRPMPQQQYRASRIFVQGDQAAVLAQAAVGSYLSMILVKEAGSWKIQEQRWRNTPPDANSVYAMLPPPAGAFTRSGSPWGQVAPALDAQRAARSGWQLRAVFDESYLHIRIESSGELPAPGSTIEKPPGGWPVLRIAVAGAGEFVVFDEVDVGDQATFDERGRANSHRHFAAYSLRLERDGREVFSTTAGLKPAGLIDVGGRHLDLRIPLRSLNIDDARAAQITLSDSQRPKGAIFNAQVPRYPR